MADKKISQFTVLAEAGIDAANDVLPIVDATGPETKKASVSAIVGAGALAGVGELNVDNIAINGNAITSTNTNGNIDLTPDGTGEVNISKVDIDSGAIDGTIIGGAVAAAGTFTTLGATTGNITTVNATTVDATNVEVTNVKAKDGTAAITIADSTGAVTVGAGATFSGGNLDFSGTAQRITGDMSNATVANRLYLQNSVTNGNTSVSAIPNGTSVVSGFIAFNNSDPTNAAFAQLATSAGTEVRLASAITGTGTYLPMTFYTGGSERVRIDTSGNVVVNTAAIATTATDGFLYVPTCAGAPTGTPTSYAGRAPIVVDTTNNKLYFYSNGTWRDAGP